jgi:TolB protein
VSGFENRGWRWAAVGVVIAALVRVSMPAPAAAQADEYDITIKDQQVRRVTVQLAEAAFSTPSGKARQAAENGSEILGRDLIYSGLFFVMDAFGSPFLPRGVSRAWNPADETPERQPYRLESTWGEEEGSVVAEMRLIDGLGTQVAGKRYKVDSGGVRGAMHHFADEVVKRLTGVDGIAQTRIAFSRAHGEQSEIWVIDYDGHAEERVTNHNTLSLSPVWGRGRSWIAFTSYVEGQPFLYRIDQGSTRMRSLSRFDGLNTAPDWSEAKQRYALTLSKDENAEIYSIDDKGRDLKRLTHHPSIDTSPAWSPGGEQIAFTSDRSGTPQIFVMNADGGNVRRLTSHNRYSDSPAWSPDGQWIAYVARWEDTIELRIMRPDGLRQRVIVDNGLNDTPSWARDSRHIAYSSLRGGKRAVYVVDIFTGLERRLTMGSENAITPAWSQD